MKEIKLTKGKVALVDDEDYERVAAFKWCAMKSKDKKTWYAARGVCVPGQKKHVYVLLHRFILDAPPTVQVDHKNRDGLDCRRLNMRFATNMQNSYNRSVGRKNRTRDGAI